MTDDTEDLRRQAAIALNAAPRSREELEARYGRVYTTAEMSQEFIVAGFAAPLCVVRRKSDSKVGTLLFQHHPRFYFEFEEDRP